MKKNDLFELTITGYTHDGHGIGRAEGIAVFVPGAAVGDVLEVRIVKCLSNRAIGRTERCIQPSPDRIANDCPAFPACGGCNYRHIAYEAESRLKKEQITSALERIGGISCPEIAYHPAEAIDAYRNKAIFPVAPGKDGKAVFGFFRANTHAVIPCTTCRIHPPVFSELAAAVCTYMNEYGVPAYDEATQKGVVRSIFIRRGAVSGEIMVCINAAKRRLPYVEELVLYLKAAAPELTSVLLSHQPEASNRLIGERIFRIWGEPVITDVLAGNTLSLSPHTFYQVNHAQCERLYAQILTYAAQCAPLETLNVLDLFCGAGSITLALARRCRSAVGIESVPDAVRDAEANAAQNQSKNVRFFCADAQDATAQLAQIDFHPDLVVVDPPRKGLAESVCQFLTDLDIQHLIYVSCDPATLARDVARLRSGGYQVDAVSGFDLFPRTANVETVCLLSKQSAAY